LVGISSHLEEGKLPGRLLWKKKSNYYESLSGFPSPGFVFKFRDPDSWRDLFVTETRKAVLNGFGDPGHNSIKGRDFLEKLDNRMAVEGRIASDLRKALRGFSSEDLWYGVQDGYRPTNKCPPRYLLFCLRSREGVDRKAVLVSWDCSPPWLLPVGHRLKMTEERG